MQFGGLGTEEGLIPSIPVVPPSYSRNHHQPQTFPGKQEDGDERDEDVDDTEDAHPFYSSDHNLLTVKHEDVLVQNMNNMYPYRKRFQMVTNISHSVTNNLTGHRMQLAETLSYKHDDNFFTREKTSQVKC